MNSTNPHSTPAPPVSGPRPNARRRPPWVRIAFALGLLVFLAASWFSTPRAEGPVHKGKHLSQYLAQLLPTVSIGEGKYSMIPLDKWDTARMTVAERESYAVKYREADGALRALERECLPFLLQELSNQESMSERLKERTLQRLHLRAQPSRTMVRRWQAVTACRMLKQAQGDVSPLLPGLRKLAVAEDANTRVAALLLLDEWGLPDPPAVGSTNAPSVRKR